MPIIHVPMHAATMRSSVPLAALLFALASSAIALQEADAAADQLPSNDTPPYHTAQVRRRRWNDRRVQSQNPDEVMVYAAVLDEDDPMLHTQAPDESSDDLADGDTHEPHSANLVSEEWKSTEVQVNNHEPAMGRLDGVIKTVEDTEEFKSIEKSEEALIEKREELREKREELIAETNTLENDVGTLENLQAELAKVEDMLGIDPEEDISKKRKKKRFRAKFRKRAKKIRKKRAGGRFGGNGGD